MEKNLEEGLRKIGEYAPELKMVSEKECERIKSRRLELPEEFLKEENKRGFYLKKESLEKLKSRLKIERIPFRVINKDLIKVEGEKSDFLLAISTVGIEGLDFIQGHYKDDGFETIATKEMYWLRIPEEVTGFKDWVHMESKRLELIYKPIILEMPKCIKKNVLIPKDIQKLYQDIKGIVEKVYIKNFSLDSIFYIESSDKYIILDIEEYAPLNRNVEIDLEQFLYKGNIYKYKGEPLYFEGYQLLTY